jgi:uncharacterized protein YuzE
MNVMYHPEFDMLNITFIDKTGASSREVSENIVFDYDDNGKIVGLEISHASAMVDVHMLVPRVEVIYGAPEARSA